MEFWEILVPTIRNSGKPFTLKFHRVWDKKVRAITGGLTIVQPVKGQWVAPCGTLFNERMIPVRVMANADQMEKIADFTAAYYEQQAILWYRVSDCVRLKKYTDL